MSTAAPVQALLLRILRDAAWAPVAVLLLHALVVQTPYRAHMAFVLHFLGGAAIAYFFFRCLHIGGAVLGSLRQVTQYLLGFALASTVAVLWEIGEFASDQFLGTHVQKSLSETMSDLIAGLVGAACSLVVIALIRRSR